MNEKLKEIANYYGIDIQTLKLIEELSELIRALCRQDYDNIIEELADVEIMLEQVKYLGNYNTEEVKYYKIDRQLKRMKAENNR